MVESSFNESKSKGYILVCPNMSMRWQSTKIILWSMALFVMFLASVMTYFGFWMVLPFAGLEVIALCTLSYWVAYQCCRKEVIHIEKDRVIVEKGHTEPEFVWQSEKFWIRLVIDKPEAEAHPLKLFLRRKQELLEIGGFLNDEDKQKLISELRPHIGIGH